MKLLFKRSFIIIGMIVSFLGLLKVGKHIFNLILAYPISSSFLFLMSLFTYLVTKDNFN